MKISVIIPVYMADKFVSEALKSALDQPETGEVLLIEDGSADDSIQICKELAGKYENVRLLQHKDGKNHGAGASRNLGIINAKCDYICFLDADDYFLPGRFSVTAHIFDNDPEIEGVYEAVGVHFENEVARERWFKRTNSTLTTMKKRVSPEELFEAQSPVGNLGYCPTDGWVLKRSVFEKTGLFDEHLYLHQDASMYVKLAAVGRMAAGSLDKPVAMRRVHDHNRILAPRPPVDIYNKLVLMWITLWRWGKLHLDGKRRKILLMKLLRHAEKPYKNANSKMMLHARSCCQLTTLLIKYPDLFAEFNFWKTYFRNLYLHKFILFKLWKKHIRPHLRKYNEIRNLRHTITRNKKELNIILGSGGIKHDGWIGTDIDVLDITSGFNWKILFSGYPIDRLLAEHVWEHLTNSEAKLAASNCFDHLKPHGYLKIAVPDGYYPDPAYINYVKPGGNGLGSEDHKVLYNYKTLQDLFVSAGFKAKLLEYWDEYGVFHFEDWNPSDGPILRSRRYDKRNEGGKLAYTSLIMDAIKPY